MVKWSIRLELNLLYRFYNVTCLRSIFVCFFCYCCCCFVLFLLLFLCFLFFCFAFLFVFGFFWLFLFVYSSIFLQLLLSWWLHVPVFRDVIYQPFPPGQISPYDNTKKSNFVPARRDSFPSGICLDLFTFSFNFPLQAKVKLLFHSTWAGWSSCMGKFRPSVAGSREYKRGNQPIWDETFHM